MNILFISFDDVSVQKGSSVHVLELISNLEKRGHAVKLVAQAAKEVNGISSFYNIGSFLNRNHEIEKFLGLLKSLMKAFLCLLRDKKNNDIIYTRDSFGALLAVFIKDRKKNKVIYEVNGLACEERRLRGKYFLNQLYIRFIGWFERLAVKKADRVIAVTDRIRSRLCEKYSMKENSISVISNGVNVDLFKPDNNQELTGSLRKKLQINKEDKIICYTGGMVRWQGIEYLIESAPYVIEKMPRVKYLVVGDGYLRSGLEKEISELKLEKYFILTGMVAYKAVAEYIKMADICVSPFLSTRNEDIGLSPLKVYGYIACGKPVVSSRIYGLEFIEEQGCGLLVEPENSGDLGKAITGLLADEARRKAMGENGYRYARKECSWAKTAEKVERVCEGLIK